jgi:hypothetical protein
MNGLLQATLPPRLSRARQAGCVALVLAAAVAAGCAADAGLIRAAPTSLRVADYRGDYAWT